MGVNNKKCFVCANSKNNHTLVTPNYTSLDGKEHTYLVCAKCKGLQLVSSTIDYEQIYNSGYGSFLIRKKGFLNKFFRKYRNKWAFWREGGVVGRLAFNFRKLPTDYTIVSKYASKNTPILDVGCGIGNYLDELHDAGFSNLTGLDPFLLNNTRSLNGVKLYKSIISNFYGSYDLIISHHSFEHVADPNDFLKSIKKLLSNNGILIITVPIIDELYEEYGVHTSTIMPPQHTFMYSIKGLKFLALLNDFKIIEIMREAESYLQWSINSYLLKQKQYSKDAKVVPTRILKCLKKTARKIKDTGGGDNVSIVLRVNDNR